MSVGFRASQGLTYFPEFIRKKSPRACCELQWSLNWQAGKAPGWYCEARHEKLTLSCEEVYSVHSQIYHSMSWTLGQHGESWSYPLPEFWWGKPYSCWVSALRRTSWYSSTILWPSTSANWWTVSRITAVTHGYWLLHGGLQWKSTILTRWIQKLTAGKVKCEAKISEVTVCVCVCVCVCVFVCVCVCVCARARACVRA